MKTKKKFIKCMFFFILSIMNLLNRIITYDDFYRNVIMLLDTKNDKERLEIM